MERDFDICLFTVVPKGKFKALLLSGRYERRSKTVLIAKEKLADGRDDFVVLDTEWAKLERAEVQVLEEIRQVSDDNTLVEIIVPSVTPTLQPKHDGIPEADKRGAAAYGIDQNQPLPEHPESSRKPSWFRSIWWEINSLFA